MQFIVKLYEQKQRDKVKQNHFTCTWDPWLQLYKHEERAISSSDEDRRNEKKTIITV